MLRRLEYPRRATRSRRCALKIRIASAGTHARNACIVGRHCKNSSPCCCLSFSWFIYPTFIASFAMRRLLDLWTVFDVVVPPFLVV